MVTCLAGTGVGPYTGDVLVALTAVVFAAVAAARRPALIPIRVPVRRGRSTPRR